jgi:hypothetical protein
MLMDISLFGYSQMFTFANIGPVLDNTVSFKNLINKTCSSLTSESVQSVSTFTRKDDCNGVFYFKNITINVCYNRARVWREHALNIFKQHEARALRVTICLVSWLDCKYKNVRIRGVHRIGLDVYNPTIA